MSTKSLSALAREKRQRRGEGEGRGSSSSIRKCYNDRAAGGILEHVHRVCFRPSVPSALQLEVAKKLGISRRALSRGAGAIEMIKPLYDLIDSFNQLGYKVSDLVSEELKVVKETLKSAAECSKEDYINRVLGNSSRSIKRDIESSLIKNRLKAIQKNIKALSDLTEIKTVIKDAADRIQRERPYLKGDVLEMEELFERDVEKLDVMEDALQIVEAAEYAKMPKDVSTLLNVCMARTRRVLLSHSACMLLQKPLKMLQNAIIQNNDGDVMRAVHKINNTIDSYDTLQMTTCK